MYNDYRDDTLSFDRYEVQEEAQPVSGTPEYDGITHYQFSGRSEALAMVVERAAEAANMAVVRHDMVRVGFVTVGISEGIAGLALLKGFVALDFGEAKYKDNTRDWTAIA